MKRTYQPKKRQRSKVHGFRKRMKSTGGSCKKKKQRSSQAVRLKHDLKINV